jgi:hypothetical protein
MNKIIIKTLLIIIIVTTQFSFGFSIDNDIIELEKKYLHGNSKYYDEETAKVLDTKIINNRKFTCSFTTSTRKVKHRRFKENHAIVIII